MILVDYRCRECRAVQQQWTISPPPSTSSCPSCGNEARRLWAAIGLGGRSAEPSTAPASTAKSRPLCSRYPQIPALCHMSESAGRMWVAKYEKDNRTIESELARQEHRAKDKPPTMADAVTHLHHPAPQSPLAATAP